YTWGEPTEREVAEPSRRLPTEERAKAEPLPEFGSTDAERERKAKEDKERRAAEEREDAELIRHGKAALARWKPEEPKGSGVPGEYEAELPYPDRTTIRKATQNIKPEYRIAWARAMRRMLDRTGEVTLDAIPRTAHPMLGAARERIAFLLEHHPRGVIKELL